LNGADPPLEYFDIPAGKASETIRSAALQGEIQILFSDAVVKGINTRAVCGKYTPQQALLLMLKGTGLKLAQANKNGAYAITFAASNANPVGSERSTPPLEPTQTQPEMNLPPPKRTLFRSLAALFVAGAANTTFTIAQDANGDEIVKLSPFSVEASADDGYASTNSISASRLSTSIQQLPVSLQVVTKDFLEDTLSFKLEDALQYQASVSQAQSDREQGIFNIRGFTTNRIKRNGFTTYYVHDLGNTSRVEVVKGPASLLYGEMEPGGVINYITESPTAAPRNRLDITLGSDNHKRVTVNSSGPLADEKFRYGITANWMDEDRWVDDWGAQQKSLNAVAQWLPWDGAMFKVETILFERKEDLRSPAFVYNKSNYEAWLQLAPDVQRSIVQSGGDQPSRNVSVKEDGSGLNQSGGTFWSDIDESLPRETNTAIGDLDSDLSELALSFETPLGENHLVRGIVRYTETSLLYARTGAGNFRLGVGRDGLRGGGTSARNQENDDLFSQIDFTGAYYWGDTSLRWVAGWERLDFQFRGTTWGRDRSPGATTAAPRAYFNPDFARNLRPNEIGYQPGAAIPSPTFPTIIEGEAFDTVYTDDGQENVVNSFYGLLQFSAFSDRMFLMGGLRRESGKATDTVYVANRNRVQNPPTVIENPKDEATVPQVGGSFKVLPGVNLFASYSESFKPQRGVARDQQGVIFKKPPQTGEGTDIGLKFNTHEGRFSATVSYFDITVRDIMGRDSLGDGSPGWDILIDGRQVDGFEFDGLWRQGGNQLLVSYSNVSGEGVGAVAGNPVPNLPDERFALWNKYSFNDGALEGFFVGLGWSYTAARQVTRKSGNTDISEGSYGLWDAAIGYNTTIAGKDVLIRLNVKNITDEAYLIPNSGANAAHWANPRQVYLTTRINF
jgi:iron complex outermembrane recepter protein